MKATKKSIGTPAKRSGKPFLAARIPASLGKALDSHVESTGESKTDALINALAMYLKWSDKGEIEAGASDRLSILEKRVDEIEKILKEPKQLGIEDAIPIKREEKREVIEKDNKIDNKDSLDNRQMSENTGIKYETIRSRHKRGDAIEAKGKTYQPTKEGKKCVWQPIN